MVTFTDRTEADVALLGAMLARGWDNLTDTEKEWWLTGGVTVELTGPDGALVDADGNTMLCPEGIVRGAYNEWDMNRVAANVEYLAALFASHGYFADVAPKANWRDGDIPAPEQLERYIADIHTIRGLLALPAGTPEAPGSMDALGCEAANDIERILSMVEDALERLPAAFRHCGTFYSGQGGLRI